MIYKTPHRKLNREQHEHHFKPGVNPGATEGKAFPAPLETAVVSLFNDTNIIWYENRVEHQHT